MHKTSQSFIAACLCVACGWAAAGTATVVFVQPENFGDAGHDRALPTPRDRAQVQQELARHLERLAADRLAADASIAIEVLDIDLAGQFEPVRGGEEVRVIRDVTGPRIRLRYVLTQGSRVVGAGEERVSDINFLTNWNPYPAADRLRYEKAMLDRWFARNFGALAKG